MRTTAEAVTEAGRRGAAAAIAKIRARIDQDRRSGKRDHLRKRRANEYTVNELSVLLSGGDNYIPCLDMHGFSSQYESMLDRLLQHGDVMGARPLLWPRDLHLSRWEVLSDHRRRPCFGRDCGNSCNNCNLYICALCGGSEGSLLPVCPERRLTPNEDAAYYEHYRHSTGPFAACNHDTVKNALVVLYERYFDDVGSMPPPRPGVALYYAVCELQAFLEEGELS